MMDEEKKIAPAKPELKIVADEPKKKDDYKPTVGDKAKAASDLDPTVNPALNPTVLPVEEDR